jgi:hypothetical protein
MRISSLVLWMLCKKCFWSSSTNMHVVKNIYCTAPHIIVHSLHSSPTTVAATWAESMWATFAEALPFYSNWWYHERMHSNLEYHSLITDIKGRCVASWVYVQWSFQGCDQIVFCYAGCRECWDAWKAGFALTCMLIKGFQNKRREVERTLCAYVIFRRVNCSLLVPYKHGVTPNQVRKHNP